MTPERKAILKSQPQTTVVERLVAAEMLPEAMREIDRLDRAFEQAASFLDGKGFGQWANEIRKMGGSEVKPPEHIIQYAIQSSLKSPCQSKRGVAIFDGDMLVTVGWNRKPRGFECDGSDACKRTCGREAVHAEQMALLAAGFGRCHGTEMLHVKTVDGVLVPSGPPSCLECSKLIMAVRLGGMWLYHEGGWKRYSSTEFHRLTLSRDSPNAT